MSSFNEVVIIELDMTYCNLKPIAVLLAAYNAEKYLAEQIDSLLSQTNQEWTLYIRNDGSKDSTSEIVERYCCKYPDKIIEIDKSGRNLGCRGNFFRLLQVVVSDYYMFCDADDVWLPEKIEISYRTLKSKELLYPNKALLVHTDKVVCDEYMNVIAKSWWYVAGLNPDLFLKFRYIPISPVVGGATTLFNRTTRECCLPIPIDPPQHDCWIPMQAAKYGKIFSIHNPLILYRQHATNAIGAPCEPYQFKFSKFWKIGSIIKRDYQLAKYFQRLGYGIPLKYYYTRILVLFRLQWSKFRYE